MTKEASKISREDEEKLRKLAESKVDAAINDGKIVPEKREVALKVLLEHYEKSYTVNVEVDNLPFDEWREKNSEVGGLMDRIYPREGEFAPNPKKPGLDYYDNRIDTGVGYQGRFGKYPKK